jgi:hypothetical protein
MPLFPPPLLVGFPKALQDLPLNRQSVTQRLSVAPDAKIDGRDPVESREPDRQFV